MSKVGIRSHVRYFYHGTRHEYVRECALAKPLQPTRRYIPGGEWDGDGEWIFSTTVWITDDPCYAAYYGDVILKIAVPRRKVHFRLRAACGAREYIADCWNCSIVGVVRLRNMKPVRKNSLL